MNTPMYVLGLLLLAGNAANAALAVKEGDRRSAMLGAGIAGGVFAILIAYHIVA
jgi:hypothetical protein